MKHGEEKTYDRSDLIEKLVEDLRYDLQCNVDDRSDEYECDLDNMSDEALRREYEFRTGETVRIQTSED